MTTVELENFARRFFKAVDAQHAEGLRPFISDNVRLQMANMPASEGAVALIEAFEATEQRFTAICHDIEGIWTGRWEQGDVVSVEAIARYQINDGRKVELPVTSTLRLNGKGEVADYRIFMDPTPAFTDA